MRRRVLVRKASGELEEYDPAKIRAALERSGADDAVIDDVLAELKKKVYNGIKTGTIFKMVHKLLRKHERHSIASRFDLKNAIMRLGPVGYPFETFVGGVVREYGYKIKLRQILRGKCVTHEIDVVAEKEPERIMIECKFHNRRGIKCHVQTGLYTWARFLDLQDGAKLGLVDKFTQPWLVTNTKFTTELVQYAECKGMKITSWNYPRDSSLRKMVEEKNIYPVTVLQSVDRFALARLFNADLMLVRDIKGRTPEELSRLTKLSKRKAATIIYEANRVYRQANA